LKESLAFSHRKQRDFTLDIDETDRTAILFGDEVLGLVPPAGAVIKVTYRVGGGLRGNVAANTIQTIIGAQLALLAAQVTNPVAATGGSERESIEHAVLHAPKVFRSLGRAVTTEDYIALALNFPGVGKVRAEAKSWSTVTLYVAPKGGGQISDTLRTHLLAYFEDKRPITTLIEIKPVDYVNIYITAHLGVKSHYDVEEVKSQVQRVAGDLLAFDAVDFGQTLYLSKFYEAIEAIEGVEHVTITEFKRERAVSKAVFFAEITAAHQLMIHFEIIFEVKAFEKLIGIYTTAQVTLDRDPEVVKTAIQHAVDHELDLEGLDIEQVQIQLKKFHDEVIKTISGIAEVIFLSCQYKGMTAQVESSGKIKLEAHEIPQGPPERSGGIRVWVEETD